MAQIKNTGIYPMRIPQIGDMFLGTKKLESGKTVNFPFEALGDVSVGDLYLYPQILRETHVWVSGYVYKVVYVRWYDSGVVYEEWFGEQFTLSASDATYNRLDVIALNLSDGSLSIVEGVPSPVPSLPSLGADQLMVTFATVYANTTSPEGVSNEYIYAENVEWVGGVDSGSVMFNDMSPQSGSFNIRAIGDFSFRFTDSADCTGLSSLVVNMFLYIDGDHAFGKSVLVECYDGSGVLLGSTAIIHGQYGFDSMNTSTWQTIVIPRDMLGLVDGVELGIVVFKGGQYPPVRFDNIYLQYGVEGGVDLGDYLIRGGYQGTAQDLYDLIQAIDTTSVETGLVSGDVYYSGSGMVYENTVLVYKYLGTEYVIASGQVTLNDGGSDDRFDIIAIDSNSNSLVVIEGTEGANPVIPYTQLSETQISVVVVYVPSGATSIDIDELTIYDEHEVGEFNMATYAAIGGSEPGTVDFDSTINPSVGTKHIRSNLSRRTGIRMSGSIDSSVYNKLYMKIRFGSNFIYQMYINAFGVTSNSSNVDLLANSLTPIDPLNTTDYQQVVFPLDSLNVANITALNIRTNGNNSPFTYDLDDVYVTSDAVPTIDNTQQIKVYSNGSWVADTLKLDFIDGNNTTSQAEFDAINNKVTVKYNGQAGGGGNATLTEDINQAGHGLSVGDAVRNNSGSYEKALADDPDTADVIGVVSAVADTDNFTLQFGGVLTSGTWTNGTHYFLSNVTEGLITTEPTYNLSEVRQYIGVGVSNGLLLNISIGEQINTGSGGGSSSATTTANTGSSVSLANALGNYCNMSSANATTTYSTTGAVVGGYACIYINASSEPTVTGGTKASSTDIFQTSTNMLMHIKNYGGSVGVRFWFEQI